MKKALITGITGQDGSYLAEFLLKKGYQVHGIKRRASLLNTGRVDHLYQEPYQNERNFILHYGDLTDATNIIRLIQKIEPDEVYNLGAQSHVKVSFESPEYTANSDAMGTLRLLEAIRILRRERKTKFYQASTSEMFGASPPPQDEKSRFYPRSPYGVAKLYSHWITINYREAYDFFAVSGILFNHESPRRGETFVTRKITRAASRIKYGLQKKLLLGNLEARRDWGHARDFVRAMYLMLRQKEPKDYVIATGEQHSVRELCELAFSLLGIDLKWQGQGKNEKGIDKNTDKIIIEIDKNYYRPTEVNSLLGNAGKAKRELGWKPEINFKETIKEMVEHDAREAKKELYLKKEGYKINNIHE